MIENAFGIFIQTWGILWRKLTSRCLRDHILLVVALARLHNFKIDTDGYRNCEAIRQMGSEHEIYTYYQNKLCPPHASRLPNTDNEFGGRKDLVKIIKDSGQLRP
jgi:hypothetical protein